MKTSSFFALLLFSLFGNCPAQDGTPDLGFSQDGIVVHTYNYYSRSLSHQISGNIVVCSDEMTGSNSLVTRYLPDGSVDASFGSGGLVYMRYGTNNTQSLDVSIDYLNNIWVAGYTSGNGTQALMTKLNGSNGSFNTSFGISGRSLYNQGTEDWEFRSVYTDPPGTIGSDGSALVAGVASQIYLDSNNLAARLMKGLVGRVAANGTPDPTFGQNGFVTVDPFYSNGALEFHDIRPDNQGRIMACGYEMRTFGVQPAVTFTCYAVVIRLLPDGRIDSTFANQGRFYYAPYTDALEYTKNVHVGLNDEIVVTGLHVYNGISKFLAIKLLESGNFDFSFGNNGVVEVAYNNLYQNIGGNGAALQDDGKLLVGGVVGNGIDTSFFAVCRLNPDGNLDAGFGNALPGFALNLDGNYITEGAMNLALTPSYVNGMTATQGKIVMVGKASICTNGICQPPHIALARFNNAISFPNHISQASEIPCPVFLTSSAAQPHMDWSGLDEFVGGEYSIVNLNGQILATGQVTSGTISLPRARISSGRYVMRFHHAGKVFNKPFSLW